MKIYLMSSHTEVQMWIKKNRYNFASFNDSTRYGKFYNGEEFRVLVYSRGDITRLRGMKIKEFVISENLQLSEGEQVDLKVLVR